MEINEKQFIAGFNSGYILAEHEPQLLTSLLSNIKPLTSYLSGMLFGQHEYELWQTKIQLNELEQIRQKERDQRER
jgi:hypothetical protein